MATYSTAKELSLFPNNWCSACASSFQCYFTMFSCHPNPCVVALSLGMLPPGAALRSINTCAVQVLKCLPSTILPANQPCWFVIYFFHSIISQTMWWTCSNKEELKGGLALPSSARERESQQEHNPQLKGEVVRVGVFYSDNHSQLCFLFLNYSRMWKNGQVSEMVEKWLKYQTQWWECNEVHMT